MFDCARRASGSPHLVLNNILCALSALLHLQDSDGQYSDDGSKRRKYAADKPMTFVSGEDQQQGSKGNQRKDKVLYGEYSDDDDDDEEGMGQLGSAARRRRNDAFMDEDGVYDDY